MVVFSALGRGTWVHGLAVAVGIAVMVMAMPLARSQEGGSFMLVYCCGCSMDCKFYEEFGYVECEASSCAGILGYYYIVSLLKEGYVSRPF